MYEFVNSIPKREKGVCLFNVQDMCFFEYQDDIYCLRYHKDEQYLCWRCKDNRSFTYTGDIRVRPVNVKIVATRYVD